MPGTRWFGHVDMGASYPSEPLVLEELERVFDAARPGDVDPEGSSAVDGSHSVSSTVSSKSRISSSITGSGVAGWLFARLSTATSIPEISYTETIAWSASSTPMNCEWSRWPGKSPAWPTPTPQLIPVGFGRTTSTQEDHSTRVTMNYYCPLPGSANSVRSSG